MIDKMEAGGADVPETDLSGSGSQETDDGNVEEILREGEAGQEGDELQIAREETEEQKNKYLRAVAELENVRRRAQRDIENAHRYGMERLAKELLGVKDSLEIGLQAVEDSSAGSVAADGFSATLKQLSQCLEKFGIAEVDPAGEVFNPELHEAMAMQPSDDQDSGTVITVVQKGYTLHDRLLRPARVIVSQLADG